MPLSNILGAGKLVSMTSLFAPAFFALFLPFCIITYALVPKKLKKFFLLVASYGFFWFVSGTLVIYLAATTLSMHYFGIWLDYTQGKMKSAMSQAEKEIKKVVKKRYITRQRYIVLMAVSLNIGVLLLLKYSKFFTVNINDLLAFMKVPLVIEIPKYLLPIGISFFTLQSLSYIFDVYRGVTKADENLFRLALFLSFFPIIVEGPICRYNQIAEELWDAKPITYRNLTLGLQRFLFGMMKKIVIADRLNPFVKVIFKDYANYEGGVIAFAAVCYTVQLYMDFSGSMDAVLGVSQIFGITVPENFKRPFFSKSISEFWKRWHITLGMWFRDYVFYPITTSGKMKKLTASARKKIGNHYGPLVAGSIALFSVWICNGLWHGSAWNFVFFGMYHFALILCGNLISPVVKSFNHRFKINPQWFFYRLLQMVRTSVLVVIGELFFRAEGLKNGLQMFRKMITDFSFSSLNTDMLIKCGVDYLDFVIAGAILLIIFIISALNEKGIEVRETLAKKNIFLRWGVYYILILIIVIFGAYGIGYAPVDPLYAQF